MKSDEIIAKLREHERELRAAGVTSLALFGSAARGEQHDDSDIDVVVRLSTEARREGFAYFGRLDSLSQRLTEILERPVDVIAEPVRKERLRRSIEKDRVIAFKNPIRRFEDILDNIDLIKDYTRGASYDSFVQDRKTQDAVERCLLRISEAASKLETFAGELIPDQPWSQSRAVGNRLRHEYDTVDPQIIWNIVNRDLESLKSSVEIALNTLRR